MGFFSEDSFFFKSKSPSHPFVTFRSVVFLAIMHDLMLIVVKRKKSSEREREESGGGGGGGGRKKERKGGKRGGYREEEGWVYRVRGKTTKKKAPTKKTNSEAPKDSEWMMMSPRDAANRPNRTDRPTKPQTEGNNPHTNTTIQHSTKTQSRIRPDPKPYHTPHHHTHTKTQNRYIQRHTRICCDEGAKPSKSKSTHSTPQTTHHN